MGALLKKSSTNVAGKIVPKHDSKSKSSSPSQTKYEILTKEKVEKGRSNAYAYLA